MNTFELVNEYTATDVSVLEAFLHDAVNANTTPEIAPLLESIESNFNLQAVKFLGRAEIVQTVQPDVYVRLNIHIMDNGIATVRGANDQPVGKQVTQSGDMIIVKLSRLAYGTSEAQNASALNGYTRVSESRHDVYLAVSRDNDGKLTVNHTMSYGVKDKSFANTGVFAEKLITQADRDMFAGLVNTYLRRVETNKNARDARYVDIGGKRTPIGMFGAMKRQNASK